MIRAHLNHTPQIAIDAYIDEAATIIGQCIIESECSIWPNAVLRGDVQQITIGAKTNIQDGTIIHCASTTLSPPTGIATTIGQQVTIGHGVILHACTISDLVLVGMGSIIMDGAFVESQVIIGANTLVPPGKRLESGYLYTGSPFKKVRELTTAEKKYLNTSAIHYVELAQSY